MFIILKAFTFIELTIVLVVMGILATLSIAPFVRSMEHNRGKQAESNLEVIYHAQKRYFLDKGTYYFCSPNPGCTKNRINSNLGIDVSWQDFTYTITRVAGGNPDFTATATRRNSGLCARRTMSITEMGGPVIKRCDAW